MKNISQLMKQAQQMQAQMAEMQNKLKEVEVTGIAGGKMVSVVLTGSGDLKSLTVDPTLINPEEKEVLEDLIVAAHRDAKNKLEQHMAQEMGKLTGGMGLPPGLKLPF